MSPWGWVRRHPLLACLVAGVVVWLAVPSSDPTPAAPDGPVTAMRSSPAPTPTPSHRPAPRRTTAPVTAAPQRTLTSQVDHSRTALAVLATLPVAGRAPMTDYARDRFGQSWLDADRNGCDTRNDILRRDLTRREMQGSCVVLAGTLVDPYSARSIRFVRGGGDEVDIDHVVPLGNAWATGAWKWGIKKRAALANDPFNLLASDMHLNRQKQDGDAATWLPPLRSARCGYVARMVGVKHKYALAVTPPERDAIAGILATCPGQRVPEDTTHAPTRVDHNITDPGPPGAQVQKSPAGPRGLVSKPGQVSYDNCTAVRAAGAAPIHRGDPGYASHLDRDGDGVGCE